MKSKPKTPSPTRHTKAKAQANRLKSKLKPKARPTPKPTGKAKTKTKPKAISVKGRSIKTPARTTNTKMSAEKAAETVAEISATSATSSTTSTSTPTSMATSAPTSSPSSSPSSSSSSSAAPSPKTPGTNPTRHRKSYGDYKALAPYLAKLPPITGYDEYDLRGVESEGEMIVGANYDYAREALRQALLRLPWRGQILGAENLAKVIKDEPHLLSCPIDHGNLYYFEQMSYMVVIWKTYAPDEPFPPPFVSFIEKIRPEIARYHQPNPVIAFMNTDDTPIRHKGSQATSDTIVTHIPKNLLRKPSLKEAIRAFTQAARASGAFGENGKSRPTNDWLALTYHKYAQGNQEPKPYLRFPDQLRPGTVTIGTAASKIYAGAFPKPYNAPVETTWSSAVARAEERIMTLTEVLMKLVGDYHITPTVVPSFVGRWPVNEQPEPTCS